MAGIPARRRKVHPKPSSATITKREHSLERFLAVQTVKPVRSTLVAAKFHSKATKTVTYFLRSNSEQNPQSIIWRTVGHIQRKLTAAPIRQTNTSIGRLTAYQASIDKT
ncbi:unnamed protein product [Phytophthora fragariaefolia]|uniref:Unnamed protein product n=1 Tax=Phytophthora fragariaefolia TaxID=1490495 RepID=A0A9W6XA06_9STRA|nr:unnamed protein product [Phytophthora fragariaefolia]